MIATTPPPTMVCSTTVSAGGRSCRRWVRASPRTLSPTCAGQCRQRSSPAKSWAGGMSHRPVRMCPRSSGSRIESDAAPSGELSLAVDVGPNQVWSSIVACGGGVIEVIERRRGATWLTERMVELVARHPVAEFGLDPAGPEQQVSYRSLSAKGYRYICSTVGTLRACGALAAGITDKTFSHRGEPELLAAVGGASRRAVGDGWKWSRKDLTVDISPAGRRHLRALAVAVPRRGTDQPRN